MSIRLFLGIVAVLFILTVSKVVYFNDNPSIDPAPPPPSVDEIAETVGKDTEEIDDDILDEVLKFIEETIDYFKN
ncbi:MAG: hypothetical protein PHE89_05465 [Alphaproteobacteria bacterium]|nr:hypothetical protein [Alphaproteobacteria bacterium]